METIKVKYYRLGGNASSFFDPSQPNEDNKSLNPNDVKPLKETKRVLESMQAGGLIVMSEDEAKEFMDEKQKEALKANHEAGKTLEVSAAKEQEANQKLVEAQLKLDASKKIADDLAESVKENTLLKERLAVLEQEKASLAATNLSGLSPEEIAKAAADAAANSGKKSGK